MVEDFFDNTCKFEAKTKMPDGLGGNTATWGGSPKTERFSPCYLRELTVNEIKVDDKLKAISTHRLYFEIRSINNTWRVIVDGLTYIITGVVKRKGEYAQADLRILI